MEKSALVCSRCGLPVRSWMNGWKHSAGAHTKSCGQKPDPIKRTEYARRQASEIAALKQALRK